MWLPGFFVLPSFMSFNRVRGLHQSRGRHSFWWSVPLGGPGRPDQGLDWLPYLLETLLPPGRGLLLLGHRPLDDADDVAECCLQNPNALSTGFSRPCRIASCSAACLLASTAFSGLTQTNQSGWSAGAHTKGPALETSHSENVPSLKVLLLKRPTLKMSTAQNVPLSKHPITKRPTSLNVPHH